MRNESETASHALNLAETALPVRLLRAPLDAAAEGEAGEGVGASSNVIFPVRLVAD